MNWNESGEARTSWDEHTPVAPAAGSEDVVAGDEWHDLWFGGYDFWPWTRASKDTTVSAWTENS